MKGIFRQEAIEHQSNRLEGDILLLPRFSHGLILCLLLLWVLLVAFWLASNSYARKETVLGWLEPDSGVIRIHAEGSGTIEQVLVSEGSLVSEGQPLLRINGDRMLADGDHLELLLLREYKRQKELLNTQLNRRQSIFDLRAQDIAQRIDAERANLNLVDQQLETLNLRYRLASAQVDRYESLNESGHASLSDLDSIANLELELNYDKQALSRSRVNQSNLIEQLQSELSLLPEEHANAIDLIHTQISEITQNIAQIDGQRAFVIRASRSGVVGNLQARVGQPAQNGIPLLTLLSEDTTLSAELLVPVRSAGFLEVGQPLQIRYDAFPYQKFGHYKGQILEISNSLLLPNELLNVPVQMQEAVYRVSVQLERHDVNAYGQSFPLKPGMTLSADVELAERTLFQWLLEPIISLTGRL